MRQFEQEKEKKLSFSEEVKKWHKFKSDNLLVAAADKLECPIMC